MRRMRNLVAFAVLVAVLAAPFAALAQNQTLENIPVPGSSTSGRRVHTDGTRVHETLGVGALKFTGTTYSTLDSYDLGPGTLIYCTDCTKASPCAGGSTGAWAKKRDGKTVGWDCD